MTARWDKPPTQRKVPVARRAPARGTYECRVCGEVLANVTVQAALRHADAHGGARLEMVIPEVD